VPTLVAGFILAHSYFWPTLLERYL
jgi:hypothetical protein